MVDTFEMFFNKFFLFLKRKFDGSDMPSGNCRHIQWIIFTLHPVFGCEVIVFICYFRFAHLMQIIRFAGQ